VDIAVGYSHSCAIRDDGGVDCWPNPDTSFTDFGQLDVPEELR
jgi:alpha-tubulin suppressor-like RCC1 family protein